MNAYLLYQWDVKVIPLPSGIIVYTDSPKNNQDPYIFNEQFLHTYCHMKAVSKGGIHPDDLYFWVNAGEGVIRKNVKELLCDLVFVVKNQMPWPKPPQELAETDRYIDSPQAWQDHYRWASIDHPYKPEQVQTGIGRVTVKADPNRSFQPVDQDQQRIDVKPLLLSAGMDWETIKHAIVGNAFASFPLPLKPAVARSLYGVLSSQQYVQRTGKWLHHLRQENEDLLRSRPY